eukprot:scaffold47262_cov20-Tisochrysis_lutea.AAC.1
MSRTHLTLSPVFSGAGGKEEEQCEHVCMHARVRTCDQVHLFGLHSKALDGDVILRWLHSRPGITRKCFTSYERLLIAEAHNHRPHRDKGERRVTQQHPKPSRAGSCTPDRLHVRFTTQPALHGAKKQTVHKCCHQQELMEL